MCICMLYIQQPVRKMRNKTQEPVPGKLRTKSRETERERAQSLRSGAAYCVCLAREIDRLQQQLVGCCIDYEQRMNREDKSES